MTTLADCLLAGDDTGELYWQLIKETTEAEWPRLLELASHPDPNVRRGLVSTLPLLASEPPQHWMDTTIELTNDPDPGVRDYACHTLTEQWREIDGPGLRDALADRLDDLNDDVRCEALVGLAFRHDDRAAPHVRQALSRSNGDVWRLELVAAGALGDPALHPLVLRHVEGWNDDDALTVDAVLRLTHPEGPGEDLFSGVASLYASRARGRPDQAMDLAAWQLMIEMLDIAPDRISGFFSATADCLSDDRLGLAC